MLIVSNDMRLSASYLAACFVPQRTIVYWPLVAEAAVAWRTWSTKSKLFGFTKITFPVRGIFSSSWNNTYDSTCWMCTSLSNKCLKHVFNQGLPFFCLWAAIVIHSRPHSHARATTQSPTSTGKNGDAMFSVIFWIYEFDRAKHLPICSIVTVRHWTHTYTAKDNSYNIDFQGLEVKLWW